MYEQSVTFSLCPGLSASSVCLSRAVNHYRDKRRFSAKAQRDKNARELKLANAAITDMQMRQRVAALDAKYTKELADAKAENDALRERCCRWSSSVAHQQSVSQCVKPPPPPAWIRSLPPTGRHR